jgi:GNAT superfamily N-acetyltransferase
MAETPQKSLEFSLPDGTPILIRPVAAEDKQLFIEGFRNLSERSRYLRFLRPMKNLPGTDLKFFTEIDYVNHMAWGALHRSDGVEKGIGVARYIRFQSDPDLAEAAIVVIDAFQKRRVATVLLGALYWSALQHGIRSIMGYVLAENHRMLGFLRDLGASISREDADLMRVEIPIKDRVVQTAENDTTRIIREVVRLLAEQQPCIRKTIF